VFCEFELWLSFPRAHISQNIYTITKKIKEFHNIYSKRMKEGFLTNSPVIGSTANSLRPIDANLKCMISILQALVRNLTSTTIRFRATIQLHACYSVRRNEQPAKRKRKWPIEWTSSAIKPENFKKIKNKFSNIFFRFLLWMSFLQMIDKKVLVFLS